MKILSRHQTRRRLLRKMPDYDTLHELLSKWYRTPLGEEVLKAERAMISPLISRLFGYHILQIGCSERHSVIDDSRVGHKIIFSPEYHPGCRQAVANIEELPLANGSMDVVVIHHALDFTSDSHRLLREVTRVVRPGGQLLIMGFNPYSPWGLRKLVQRNGEIPWRGRFISCGRLTDWLRLLELHIDSVSFGLHFMPVKYSKILKYAPRFEEAGGRFNSPLGGAYCILCSRQVMPITPILPRWRPLRTPATILPAAENIRVRIH
ncbi:MAG: class I SAM-dependent methyltransferase [Pseudohongiellaceae bacterium]